MRRTLVQTIPRVPSNLPVFLDALVAEVLNSRRLGAETQNRMVEQQPRQGLSAILNASAEHPAFCATLIIELIPLANAVEIYIQAELNGKGIIRLMRGLLERMFVEIMGQVIADSISRLLSLESQNYGRPLQGSGGVESRATQTTSESTTQTKTPAEIPATTLIYCPACGLANPEYARFCETCGTKLAR